MAARVKQIPASELHQLAAAYLASPKDTPGYQVLAALDLTRILLSQGIVAAADASKVCDGLFKSGGVLQGAPAYEYARFVRGFLVAARTPSHERVWWRVRRCPRRAQSEIT